MHSLETIKYMNSPEYQELKRMEGIINKMATHLIVRKETDRYGSIHFTYNGELTEQQASKVQQESGYHPHGYGFYTHLVRGGVTTWNCSNSCD